MWNFIFNYLHQQHPHVERGYFSRETQHAHMNQLLDLPITCFGLDWRFNLIDMLETYGKHYAIQGNIDPQWLLLPERDLANILTTYFQNIKTLGPSLTKGWVANLGHGVLKETPQDNVRLLIDIFRSVFNET